MDTSVTLAGFTLSHPIINGAGPRSKTVEDLAMLIEAGVAMPVVGSYTILDRFGNPEPRYWDDGANSINAIGLANGGKSYLKDHGPEMVEMAHAAGLHIGLSVAGSCVEDYLNLTRTGVEIGFDLIEENVGCPNSEGTLISFNLRIMEDIARGVKPITQRFSFKPSPYSDPGLRREVAELYRDLGVPAVTLCNTFPDVLELDDDLKPVLNPEIKRIGLGGGAGAMMRLITQAHVYTFRQILYSWQDIIAIGGVFCGLDVLKYKSLGAKVVAIATAHAIEGNGVFNRVLGEYIALEKARQERGFFLEE